ncbi:hypothetical protein ABLO18_16080 [Mycobacterium tuberculosis]
MGDTNTGGFNPGSINTGWLTPATPTPASPSGHRQHRRLHHRQRQQRHLVARQLRGPVQRLPRIHYCYPLTYHAVGGIGPLHVAPVPHFRRPFQHHQCKHRPGSLHDAQRTTFQDPHRRPGIRGLRTNHHLGCHRS